MAVAVANYGGLSQHTSENKETAKHLNDESAVCNYMYEVYRVGPQHQSRYSVWTARECAENDWVMAQ